jgi:hypothetical protein
VRENHSKGELDMPMKKHKPEQIVALLRQIEVEIANGKTTPQACKEAEITMQTYYRWRKEFGGLKLDQAKRLKELERENAKLKRSVAASRLGRNADPRSTCGRDAAPGNTGKHSLGQWPGVRSKRAERMAGRSGAPRRCTSNPGSPWENGYCESFNGKLRDECLNGEIFYSLREAQVVIEKWRVVYNTLRPHSALGYRPPAPAACSPWGVNPTSQPMAVI